MLKWWGRIGSNGERILARFKRIDPFSENPISKAQAENRVNDGNIISDRTVTQFQAVFWLVYSFILPLLFVLLIVIGELT